MIGYGVILKQKRFIAYVIERKHVSETTIFMKLKMFEKPAAP